MHSAQTLFAEEDLRAQDAEAKSPKLHLALIQSAVSSLYDRKSPRTPHTAPHTIHQTISLTHHENVATTIYACALHIHHKLLIHMHAPVNHAWPHSHDLSYHNLFCLFIHKLDNHARIWLKPTCMQVPSLCELARCSDIYIITQVWIHVHASLYLCVYVSNNSTCVSAYAQEMHHLTHLPGLHLCVCMAPSIHTSTSTCMYASQ